MNMKYKYYIRSECGNFRNSNQDSVYANVVQTRCGAAFLGVVCDGMGGLSHGELASSMLASFFSEWFEDEFKYILNSDVNENVIFAQWAQLIAAANRNIIQHSEEMDCSMGTTISALLLFNGRYFAAQIGDSRIYSVIGEELVQITADHSLVSDLNKAGLITENEMKVDKRRNILTRCVGIDHTVNADYYCGDSAGAAFLVCSDGFYGAMRNLDSEMLIKQILVSKNFKKNADYAIDKRIESGEKDNLSVLAVKAEL